MRDTAVIAVGSTKTRVGISSELDPLESFSSTRNRKKQIFRLKSEEAVYGKDNSALYHTEFPLKDPTPDNRNERTTFSITLQRAALQKLMTNLGIEYSKCDPWDCLPYESYALCAAFADLSQRNKEDVLQFYFDEIDVEKVSLLDKPVMNLFATGRVSGISLSVGGPVSECRSIFEGYTLDGTLATCNLGGDKLLDSLKASMPCDDLHNGVFQSLMHEKLYISANDESYQYDLNAGVTDEFNLPDGTVIELKDELFQCSEAVYFKNEFTLNDLFMNSCSFLDIDVKKTLYRNIVLGGGGACLNGLVGRMQHEIASLLPSAMAPVVVPYNKRDLLAYSGSVIVAATNNEWSVTDVMYQEMGPTVLHRLNIGV